MLIPPPPKFPTMAEINATMKDGFIKDLNDKISWGQRQWILDGYVKDGVVIDQEFQDQLIATGYSITTWGGITVLSW